MNFRTKLFNIYLVIYLILLSLDSFQYHFCFIQSKNFELNNQLLFSFGKELKIKEHLLKRLNNQSYKDLKFIIKKLVYFVKKQTKNSNWKNVYHSIIELNENNDQKNKICINDSKLFKEKICIEAKSSFDPKKYLINYNLLNFEIDNEKILAFKFIEVKRLFSKEYYFKNNEILNNLKNDESYFKTNLLIENILNEVLLITVTKGKIILSINTQDLLLHNQLKSESLHKAANYFTIFQFSLNFKAKIANLMFFEEDQNIVILSEENYLHNLNLDFFINTKILIEKISSFEINNLIELDLKDIIYFKISLKSNYLLLDIKNINEIHQQKIHSNKYFLLSNKERIVVLNNNLDLRTQFNLNYRFYKTIINSGIIGIISHDNIFFTNILGGNSILLNCQSNSKIIHAYYESNIGFLFMLNEYGIFNVFASKLSMSKVNTNECKGKLFIFILEIYSYSFKNFSKNESFLDIYKKIIYIQINSKDIFILDLNALTNNGEFIMNQFQIFKNIPNINLFQITDSIKNINMLSKFDNSLKSQINYLIFQISNLNLIIITFKKRKIKSDSGKIENIQTNKINNNYTNQIYFKIKRENNEDKVFENIFVYIFVIISLLIIVFYYKKYKSNNSPKKKIFKEDEFDNLNFKLE